MVKALFTFLHCKACAKELGLWGLVLPKEKGFLHTDSISQWESKPTDLHTEEKPDALLKLFYASDLPLSVSLDPRDYCGTYECVPWNADPKIRPCDTEDHCHSMKPIFEDAQMWAIYASKSSSKETFESFEACSHPPFMKSFGPPLFPLKALCEGCFEGPKEEMVKEGSISFERGILKIVRVEKHAS